MLSKTFGGKTVESFDGSQVLPEAWLRDLGSTRRRSSP